MNGVITFRTRINPGAMNGAPTGKNAATGGALMRPWSNTAPFGRHRVPYAYQPGRHEWRHHVPYAHQSGRHEWRPYGEKCRRRGRINAPLVKHRTVWTRDTG